MNDWKTICRVEDIPVLGSRRVARPAGTAVAVFRNSQDEVFALLDRCPHKGGPLSQGIAAAEQLELNFIQIVEGKPGALARLEQSVDFLERISDSFRLLQK